MLLPHGVEEIPQHFRAMSVLAELPGEIPPPTSQAAHQQLSVSPGPRDQALSSGLHGHWTVWYPGGMCRQDNPTDITSSFH